MPRNPNIDSILQEGAFRPHVEALSSQVAVPEQCAAATKMPSDARWGQGYVFSMCCIGATGVSSVVRPLATGVQPDQCALELRQPGRSVRGLILAFFEGQRAAPGWRLLALSMAS
jgi:hypothetical protein